MNPIEHHLQQTRTALAMGHLHEAARQLELAVSAIYTKVNAVEDTAQKAANGVSCLVNGIVPD